MINGYYFINDADAKEYISYHHKQYDTSTSKYEIIDGGNKMNIYDKDSVLIESLTAPQVYRSLYHFRNKIAKKNANTTLLVDKKDNEIIRPKRSENKRYKALSAKQKERYNETHIRQRSTWSPNFIYNTDMSVISQDIINYNNNETNRIKISVPTKDDYKNPAFVTQLSKDNEQLQQRILKIENKYELSKYDLCYNECSIELLDSLKNEIRDKWMFDHPATKLEFQFRYPNKQWPFKNRDKIFKETLEHWFTFDVLRCLPHSDLYITYLDAMHLTYKHKHKYMCPCWTVDQLMDYMTQVTPSAYFIQHNIDVPYWDNLHKTFVGGWINKTVFEKYFKYLDAIGWLIPEENVTPYQVLDDYIKSKPQIITYTSIKHKIPEESVTRTMIFKDAIKDYFKKLTNNAKINADGTTEKVNLPLIAANNEHKFAFYNSIWNIPNIPLNKVNTSYLQHCVSHRAHAMRLPEYLKDILLKSYNHVQSEYNYLNKKVIQLLVDKANFDVSNWDDNIRGKNWSIRYDEFLEYRHRLLISNSFKWRGCKKQFDEYLPVLTYKQHRYQRNITTIQKFNKYRRGWVINNRYVLDNLDNVLTAIDIDKENIKEIIENNDTKKKTNRNHFTAKRKKLLRSLWKSKCGYKRDIYNMYKKELLLHLNYCKDELENFINKHEVNNELIDIDSNDIFEFKLIEKNIDKDIYKCIPKNVYTSQACFDYINKLCRKNNIKIIYTEDNYCNDRIKGFICFVKNVIYNNIIEVIEIIKKDNSRKWLSKIDKELLECMGTYYTDNYYDTEEGLRRRYMRMKIDWMLDMLKCEKDIFKRVNNIVEDFKKHICTEKILKLLCSEDAFSKCRLIMNELRERIINTVKKHVQTLPNIDFIEGSKGERLLADLLIGFFKLKFDTYVNLNKTGWKQQWYAAVYINNCRFKYTPIYMDDDMHDDVGARCERIIIQ